MGYILSKPYSTWMWTSEKFAFAIRTSHEATLKLKIQETIMGAIKLLNNWTIPTNFPSII